MDAPKAVPNLGHNYPDVAIVKETVALVDLIQGKVHVLGSWLQGG